MLPNDEAFATLYYNGDYLPQRSTARNEVILMMNNPMTKNCISKPGGCQMNEYDSSKMADLLASTHGYQLTTIPEEADLLLLNTCSIREKHRKSIQPARAMEIIEREKPAVDYWGRWLRGVTGR